MPGFDGTGPMGMGAMTGGARGRCNPGRVTQTGPLGVRGYGRGRGHGQCNRFWATGFPGWRRSNSSGFQGVPSDATYAPEQEFILLKNQAKALKTELDAINARLKELESKGENSA